MTIRRKIDDLPDASKGWPPDSEVRFAHLLAERWCRQQEAEGARPHAIDGSRFRHSDAGRCARLISYKAAGIELTDPMDLTGVWNTSLGTLIHDAWQEALQAEHPGTEVEVKVGEGEMSGHVDAVISTIGEEHSEPGVVIPYRHVISYELKTQGGYGFKDATGKAKRGSPPSGPKLEHIIQASLNAARVGADEAVVGYLAKETLSKNYSDVADVDKFCAEWTLTREQYEPFAHAEIERINAILGLLDDEGLLAARKVPGVPGEIIDPATSGWQVWDQVETSPGHAERHLVDWGAVWGGSYCSYCSHQTLCIATEPGRIPVETAVELRRGM